MSFWQQLLVVLLTAIGTYSLYFYTRNYALKFNLNRNIVLILLIIVIVIPFIIPKYYGTHLLFEIISMVILYYLMFLYFDLRRIYKVKKNAPPIGKPKPKPNRAKNIK
ncbi:MAG TPA: hypothetical protein DDX02_02410 [Clostridiaceae bacterium]|jgi:Ca2+/H+ antiporter|nr:hypothetical protein [Clostridiaceae bacterium]